MIRAKIAGIEKALPPLVVTNDRLASIVETSDEWISSRTGIKQRHISSGQNTSDLCIETADKLIKKAGWDPLSVDLIIVGTLTPDYATPNVACMVQAALGCANAFCFDISAACSGFVYSLSAAEKFIRAGNVKRAIVLGGETLSKITDWNDRSTCVLFADGAGGVLLEASESGGIICEDLHADGSKGASLLAGYHKIDNPFFKEEEKRGKYIEMNGRDIFSFATRIVPGSIKKVLDDAGVGSDEIKYFVLHQANTRINDIIAKKLKISPEKFFSNIHSTGNTSGGSIPILLAEMDEKGLFSKGDKLILAGFGGGLTWATMLIEL